MSSLLDFQLREENEGASLEPQDAVIDQLAMIDAREQAPLDEFDRAWPTRPPARAVARLSETTGEGSTDREISEESGPRDDVSFSRDLINAYFRHMGNSPLLSREEEISVAKRIEAGQQAILHHLCQIPMLIESIREWGNELRQGHRRLRDFVDFSVLADESLRRGNNDQIVQGVAEREACPGDDQDVRVDDMETRGSPGEQAPSLSLVNREVRLMPGVLARIERISTLNTEITQLSRMRVATRVLGHNLGQEDAARVRDLLARLDCEMADLRLHPDRVSDLIAALESEQRTLQQTERELLQVTGDLHPHHDAARVAELQAKILAIAGRAGVPIATLRRTVTGVRQARRDVNSAREELVRSHLRLVVSIAKEISPPQLLGFPRSDPRRQLGPHARCREVRLSLWRQGLDLCIVVDPAVDRARHHGPRPHNPRSCAHGGEGKQGPAGTAKALSGAGPPACNRENRRPGRGSSSGRRVDVIPWAGADIPGPSDRRGWRQGLRRDKGKDSAN